MLEARSDANREHPAREMTCAACSLAGKNEWWLVPDMPIARDASGRSLWKLTREVLALFAFYSLCTAVFFRQWVPRLHVALIGPPEDNMQDYWNTWYTAFAHDPGAFFFTTMIRWPEGTTLTYHSFAYPQVFASALLTRYLQLDETALVLVQNLGLLITFPLAAVGTFYLVRHLTGSAAGAMVGAFVFAFNPSHVQHVMHHAHVSQIQFIPLFAITYILTIERKSPVLLAVSIGLFALNGLSCWYYLFYVAYFVLFHTLFIGIRDREWPTGWRLACPVVCVAGVVAVLSPMLWPMVQLGLTSAGVYARGTDLFAADLMAYSAFPSYHLLGDWSARINARLTGNEWEATVYLGVVNLLLLAWLLMSARSRPETLRLVAYVFAGMATFMVFASGDSLHVLGNRTIPMPGSLLSDLPFFRNVRTPSRAIVFTYLFLAIGVGYAVAIIQTQLSAVASRTVIAALSLLIALDFYPAKSLPMTTLVCSPGLSVIRDDPEAGIGVLDLPSGKPPDYLYGNLYMFQQPCHGKPIMQGNTSRDLVVSLRDRLPPGDLEAQRKLLKAARVKYIVINRRPMGLPLSTRRGDAPMEELSRALSGGIQRARSHGASGVLTWPLEAYVRRR